MIVAVLVLAGFVLLGFKQLRDDRADAAHKIAVASCESTNEFRSFMSSYLESQIGVPIDQAPGFDQLTPEQKTALTNLGPIFDAGRANREAYAARYRQEFPILDCTKLPVIS